MCVLVRWQNFLKIWKVGIRPPSEQKADTGEGGVFEFHGRGRTVGKILRRPRQKHKWSRGVVVGGVSCSDNTRCCVGWMQTSVTAYQA